MLLWDQKGPVKGIHSYKSCRYIYFLQQSIRMFFNKKPFSQYIHLLLGSKLNTFFMVNDSSPLVPTVIFIFVSSECVFAQYLSTHYVSTQYLFTQWLKIYLHHVCSMITLLYLYTCLLHFRKHIYTMFVDMFTPYL